MRVLISTYGSRGDVQPFVGLAVELQALGVELRLCVPPDREFADLLAGFGLPLVPAFASVQDWIARARARRAALDLPALAAEMVAAQFEVLAAAAEGCDAIVAAGLFPSCAAAQAAAEARGIRYVHVSFCPLLLPSEHHAPFAYPGQPHPPEMTDPRALWAFNTGAMDALFGEAVNGHRAAVGLPRVADIRDHVFTARPWLACDPVLGPWRPTDLCAAVQTGAWFLPDPRPLPDDLLAFLGAGPPPVYVGFGSMRLEAAPDAARTAIEAVRRHGRRTVLARGWAGLAAIDDQTDCFAVGEVNQQALFQRVAAVVHHGGAGTTVAAARAGAPQVVVPQVVDQPYWAERVADLGIGVAHEGAVPAVESLASCLARALDPWIRERAAAIAGTIRQDGAALAARQLLDELSEGRR